MTSLPHLPHCRFVRIRKSHVLFNHELHHEQQVALGVVLAVPQKAGSLRFCQLLSRDCLANEFDQGLHFVTSFLVNPLHIFAGGCIQRQPQKAVRLLRGRLPGHFKVVAGQPLAPGQFIAHFLPLR